MSVAKWQQKPRQIKDDPEYYTPMKYITHGREDVSRKDDDFNVEG